MCQFFKRFGISLLIILLTVSSLFSTSASADIKSDYKTYVMAPLTKITNWSDFAKQLATLKSNGVYALTTDVWWGDVEKNGNNQFDWSYYRQYAQTVRESGLKWVPIISTHQCGGNVGDDCNIPIPSWVWNLASTDTLTHKSETGYVNKETLSPWATGVISTQYDELYESFSQNFSDYKDIIIKIYLSGGPAGELRFPSYVSSDGWSYPSRGKLQAYTDTAKSDFRTNMQAKYSTLTNLNTAWKTNLTSWNQVNPPSDGDNFFSSGAAYNSQYGKDFMTWYQNVLIKHLTLISQKAHENFDATFGVPVGAKIAGIHWKMNDPSMPHAAEYSAGYYNYASILDQFKASNLHLTFTCLEMDNSQEFTSPYYSAPKALVTQIANLATQRGIVLNGENALAISSSDASYSESRYRNTAQHLFNEGFSGFTLLRLANVVQSNGTKTAEMDRFRDILALQPIKVNFIVKNAPTAYGDTVYVTGNRWEMGMWNNPDGDMIKLTWDNTNKDWRGTANIAANRYYEFKAVIVGSNGSAKAWEPNGNNTWSTPNMSSNYTIQW
ncbi:MULTISPECIES: family 14 glycosylhydrolase [Bacillaceae]|uniref:family 14 glycosylhydrolase n=1 Tax=Bacillaceae TaxID=186817 RepID=UPI000BFC202A|nr:MULTISPECIES: family 14 glycosylhydrolase [Bacillaceae]PGT89610.1 beta-amylase [Bacillus sp. AFS040349]UGB30820.1 family 14 glycosylhydrolase [Metabacillus sp. B2-18]